jgi:hypothetical protein
MIERIRRRARAPQKGGSRPSPGCGPRSCDREFRAAGSKYFLRPWAGLSNWSQCSQSQHARGHTDPLCCFRIIALQQEVRRFCVALQQTLDIRYETTEEAREALAKEGLIIDDACGRIRLVDSD